MKIFEKLADMFKALDIQCSLIEHPPEGRTNLASKIRGHALDQAAKAMVVQVVSISAPAQYILAVVAGDSKVDFKAIAKLFNAKKARLATADIARELTGCEMGAIPPLSFDARLPLLVDSKIRSAGTLFFNAGRLDKSFSISVEDYFHIVGDVYVGKIATLDITHKLPTYSDDQEITGVST